MFFVVTLVMLMFACATGEGEQFIAAGLFAIASAIEQAAYRYFKNKNK